MKLLRYRIKNFRAVIDTGWIECQPVTAFVGSNESGKTTILMALMKLMDPKRDYQVSDSTLKSNTGNLSKINLDSDIPIDKAHEIRPVYKKTVFIEAVLSADEAINKKLKAINHMFEPVETVHITKTLGGFYDLPGLLGKFAASERQEAIKTVLERLPVFLYFKEVVEFKSEINLAELAYKLAGVRKREALTPRESIFANLLNYFDIWQSNLVRSIRDVYGDLSKVAEKDINFLKIFEKIPLFEQRFTKGFASLTTEFRKWWGNDDITIGYQPYKKGVRITLGSPGGRQYLLENRSTGFRRFFALFLSFSVITRQEFDNTIMLFDEAGAALHPIMQRKLAYFFRELGKDSQILYNTHASYMLPVTEMNSARIVYKDFDGHVNINSVMQLAKDRSNEESLFVAEASLAMHLAKTVIIGCLPIVLLNAEDTYYLQMIKSVLIAKGKLNTIYEPLIFSAGENGIDSAAELYHADGTLPVVLLPSDEKGRGIKARLSEGMYRHDRRKLFELSDFTARDPHFQRGGIMDNPVSFEDLMPPAFTERFASDYLREILGAGFVYDRGKPFIAQVEEYAASAGITLPKKYRAELARATKICMMERYKDMRIPVRYMRVWARILKTVIKDYSEHEFEFTAETAELPTALMWHSEMETGDGTTDAQHKSLFEAFNELHRAIASGSGPSKVRETLDFLVGYVVHHFQDEEALMINCNYLGYERHKLIHDNFKTAVGGLVKTLEEQGSTENLCIQLHNMLSKWLVNHIEREDKKIGHFIAECRQKEENAPPETYEEAVTARRAQKGQMFTLSRHDVLDHIETMRADTGRFPVQPGVKQRAADGGMDYLQCGERSFGIMCAQDDTVFSLILRMAGAAYEHCLKHYSVRRQTFMKGSDWYTLTIDRSFTKKSQVYDILNECYDYVLKGGKDAGKAVKAEADEQAAIEKAVAENADKITEIVAEAEEVHTAELAKFKADYEKFVITRREIADRMTGLSQELNDAKIVVAERPKQLHLPMSLRYDEKTFALLYGTEEGVLMIVRIPKEYSEELAVDHPEICRAYFPAGPDWYFLPVDGAFLNKSSVFAVLDRALEFVKTHNKRGQKKAHTKNAAGYEHEPADLSFNHALRQRNDLPNKV